MTERVLVGALDAAFWSEGLTQLLEVFVQFCVYMCWPF